ncbi:MAG: hypothetical protein KAJ44_06730 [Thermoplasmatales archaeon]|nr:hypothetical protein [Thermoplasmatales archaeon]
MVLGEDKKGFDSDYFLVNEDAAKINAKIMPTNNRRSDTLLSPRSLNTKLNIIMITDNTTSPTVFAIDSADIIDHHT